MSEAEKVDLREFMSAKFQEQEAKLDARIGRLEVKVNCMICSLAIVAAATVAHYLNLLEKLGGN